MTSKHSFQMLDPKFRQNYAFFNKETTTDTSTF